MFEEEDTGFVRNSGIEMYNSTLCRGLKSFGYTLLSQTLLEKVMMA